MDGHVIEHEVLDVLVLRRIGGFGQGLGGSLGYSFSAVDQLDNSIIIIE